MKVAAFNVELQSSRQFSQSFEMNERLEVWRDAPGNANGGNASASRGAAVGRPEVQISDAARLAQQADVGTRESQATAETGVDEAIENDPKLSMLLRMIEFLTGKPARVFNARELEANAAGLEAGANPPATPADSRAAPPSARAGFGIEYDFNARYSESETTTFSASGTVRTADGKEIRFELGFAMSRSYSESMSVSLRAGDQRVKDPLVLDFGGPAAALSDVRFDFDLDADGTLDSMPVVGGTGFLAFDRNTNGRIDDGRELFGPTTGNGFDELAALDDDGNGWIDESDAAWSQLRVWQPDAAGQGSVQTLKEAGVGAFYLGNVDTTFSLKNAANETEGLMRASSVYLREDGSVGSVSQIDLAV